MRTTPRPPLTKRLRPVHWRVIDYFVAVLLGFFLFTVVRKSLRVNAVNGYPVYRPMQLADLIALLMVVVAVLAVALRRRRPFFMLGVLLAASVVVTALSGPNAVALLYFLPVAYVLFLIAANFERKQAAVRVLSAVVVTLIIDNLLLATAGGRGDGEYNSGTVIPVLLFVVIAWSTGYIVRQRRRYSIGLQEEAASKAVAEERLRIARELHDVVAHSMSVIAVQAGYGQYVIDSQPADARAALGAIQATSREALDEMRRMLGALRQADADATTAEDEARGLVTGGTVTGGTVTGGTVTGGTVTGGTVTGRLAGYAAGLAEGPVEGMGALASLFRQAGSFPATSSPVGSAGTAAAPLFPAPGLDDLDRLVKRTAGAGVQVEVQRRGTPGPLPASIDLSAYRVIQEALTNVVKHANASRCDVLIDYGAEQLTIRVTDSGAGQPVPTLVGAAASARSALAEPLPGGHGIIGMRERVSLLGGQFTAGPLPGYGFEVVARIPLPPGNGLSEDGA